MLDRIRRAVPERLKNIIRRSAPSADADFWYNAWDSIRRASSGIAVTPESAMRCSVFRSSVDGIASDLATIPLPVFRDEAGTVPQKAKDHPVFDLLNKRANPEMSATDARTLWQAWKYQYGDSYSWIETAEDGQILALWPMHPTHVTVLRERSTRQLYYRWRPPNEPQKILFPWEVVHHMDLSEDGLVGRKLVVDGKDSISLAIAAELFAGFFFGNGAHIGGVVEVEGKFDDPSYQRFVKSLEKRSGLPASHKALVLESGAKWKPAGVDPKAAQTMEIMRIAGEQVMRLFGIQPTMVQDNERSTFTNAGIQTLNHVKFTLMRPGVRVESQLDWKLFTEPERRIYFTRHNFNSILRGDVAARGAWYKIMVNAGIMTRNEARALEDMERVEGGDKLWVGSNTMPLDGPLPGQISSPADSDPGSGGDDNEPQDD